MTKLSLCENTENINETTQIVICVVSSFSYWSLVGPGVIAVSAFIAVLSLISAQRIARTKATLDLIEKVESTPHYQQLHATFAYFKRTDSFDRLHTPKEDKDRADRAAVNGFLSHYELVSIGIEKNILDESFYRDWMETPFVRDWNAAAKFIQRERWRLNENGTDYEYYPRLFEYYGRVAQKFSDDAVVLDESYGDKPSLPHEMGEDPST